MLTFLTILVLTFLGLRGFNQYRNLYSQREFELVPNCLLTRYPLLFLEGPSSPFYKSSYWNSVPYFLEQHGYEVLVWSLKSNSPGARLRELKEFVWAFENTKTKFHFFVDDSQAEEFNFLKCLPSPLVASANNGSEIIMEAILPKNSSSPSRGFNSISFILQISNSFFLSLHNWWTASAHPLAKNWVEVTNNSLVHQRFLTKVRSLAESDLKC